MKQKQLLFGAAYYDEYLPYDRIDTDMKLLREAGMNVIRIAESTWSTWEPQDNLFDFSHLHRMLDAAVKYDINVIIGTPTYAIPSWLAKKHPDILSVTKNGQELYGHRQLTDITNPNYLYHAERMIRRLMEEVKDCPNIIGYQLDNETRSAGAASPETQALFLAKLQKKYPDIEEFNQEFGLDYWSNRIASWDDFPDIRGTINGSLSAAYKRFLRNCITDFLHWQAAIVREYAKPGQFITHNFDFSWLEYSFGIQPEVNQFAAAECMDIAGVDIYHPSQDKLTGAEIAFGGSVARSLKKDNYLVLETQSQGRLTWLPYPGQLRLQAYSHLASGANSVMYWHWHSIHNSFESYWKGILSHNLEPNAAYRELKAFGQEVHTIEGRLLNLKKDCKTAIVVDNASLTGLDEFPINEEAENSIDYNHVLRQFYDACYLMNLECDLVSVTDDFSAYPILIVPALYSASEDTLRKLKAYAENGGHLLLGFRSGFSDEELKIYHDNQPHLLTDCIGATYDQFTYPENVLLRFTEESGLAADAFPVNNWMELVKPSTAQTWASYEHPFWGEYAAITHQEFGRGSATYLACFTTIPALQQLMRRLCRLADITLPDYAFPLILKTGYNDNGKFVRYYFNYSSSLVSLTYDGKDATELLRKERVLTNDKKEIGAWDLLILEEEE
jgi:beta-galactosidase